MKKIICTVILITLFSSIVAYADNGTNIIYPGEEALKLKVEEKFAERDLIDKTYCANQYDIIEFPMDSRLLNCLIENGVYENFIPNCEEAKKVRFLNCTDATIESLEGMQQFPNLESLTIRSIKDNGSLVQDLAPLRNLTNLHSLSIPSAKIDDIIFLSKLTKLRTLDMSNNHITDLSYLTFMKHLRVLRLDYQSPNFITDITPLTFINNLQILSLRGNKITDITPLASHKNLNDLIIRDNRVTSLQPLADLKNIYNLDFSINLIPDITPLTSLERLVGVIGSLNKLTNLTALTELKNIVAADFRANYIVDVAPFGTMENLAGLQLDRNYITDIVSLKQIKLNSFNMNLLGLSDNCIPEEQFNDIKFRSKIDTKRFTRQCGELDPEESTPNLIGIVNKDIVIDRIPSIIDEEKAEDIEQQVFEGGCSIGNGNNTDVLLILIAVSIVTRLFYRRYINKNSR